MLRTIRGGNPGFRPGRVSVVAAAASLLAITLAVTIGFSGQVAAITTNQGWADSYSVDGECYCSSSFDHGVGNFKYNGESVRQICKRLGSGPKAGRVYYNTIQCGHEPAHRDAIKINGRMVKDEVECPGRVGKGVPCNKEKGPKWNLDGSDPSPAPTPAPAPTPDPQPDPRQPGDCQATGSTRAAAEKAYANKCSAPRVDCDPVPSGGHLCSSKNIPNNPTPAPTPDPNPAPQPSPDDNGGECTAMGDTRAAAEKAYANKCSAPRVDCDPMTGGGHICSNRYIPNDKPVQNPGTNPAPTPAPQPQPAPAPAPSPGNGACTANGNSLGAAISAYSKKCSAPRVDCDPAGGGAWICSSKRMP